MHDISLLFNSLSKPDQILVALLECQYCTSRQIYHYFNYSSLNSAYQIMEKLVKRGHLVSDKVNNFSIGNVYYLTPSGADYICNKLGLSLYESRDGDLIPRYSPAATKISPSAIAHAVSINDFYFCLFSSIGFSKFRWMPETLSLSDTFVVEKGKKHFVRSDASFTIRDSLYLIEQDMNTVSKEKILSKFAGYGSIFNHYDIQSYPRLLFPVNELPKNTYYKKYIQSYSETLRQTKLELDRKLKNQKLRAKDARDLIKYHKLLKSFSVDNLQTELIKLQGIIDTPALSAGLKYAAKRDIDLKIKCISGILNGSDFNEEYKLASDYQVLNKELRSTKELMYMGILDLRINARVESIMQLLSLPSNNLLLEHIYQGLNIHVGSQTDILNFVESDTESPLKNIDILTLFYKYVALSNKSHLTVKNNEAVSLPTGVIYPAVSLTFNGFSLLICLEDASYNNIGACLRVKSILQSTALYNGPMIFFIIVDDQEQAQDIFKSTASHKSAYTKVYFINRDAIYPETVNLDRLNGQAVEKALDLSDDMIFSFFRNNFSSFNAYHFINGEPQYINLYQIKLS